MKILFINPPNKPFTDRGILIEPIDILNLASFVEHLGHCVEILDMDAQRLNTSKIREFTNYDFVIVIYDNHIPLHKDNALNELKQIGDFYASQNIPTILVGKVGTYLPSVIKDINFKIAIASGKNQEGILKQILGGKELCEINNISFINNGNVVENKKNNDVFDINKLPVVNRSLLDSKNYIDAASILTSRGCINNCSFCPVKNYWGEWQGKSPKRVVEEIESLVNNGFKKILFLDDNASCDEKRLIDISNLLIKKNIKVKLGLLASINTYSSVTFKLMYKAGFRWVHFGIESGSNEVLKKYNKNFDVNNAKNIIKELKSIGYRVRTSIIFDLEPISKESLDATINFLLETTPQEIRLHYLVSRLGTKICENQTVSTTQYIHCDNVVLKQNKDLKLLEDKKNELIDKLKNKGYKIITDTLEWDEISKLDNSNLKFISFCPSRYGLGW